MKQTVKRIASNPLISGSFFVFSGGMVASFVNFIFNLGMSRNLSVSQYGNLISLISIIMLVAIPAGSIVPTIVSVAGSYFAKNDNAHLKAFIIKILKPVSITGGLFIVLFVVFSPFVGTFLKISNPFLILITAVAIFLAYIGTVGIAFMQAGLYFKLISVSNIVSALVKLMLGFLLVFVGFQESGAIFAFFMSLLIPVIVSGYAVRKALFAKFNSVPKISFLELVKYGIPSSLAILSLNSFISTDIILVKHLFSPEKAGLYAGLSLVGKVIFYVTAPIGTVMFPTIIHRYNKNQNYQGIIFLAFGLVLLASLIITAFYYSFPEFTLTFFLKNPDYQQVAPLVGLFGILMGVYSLVSLLTYYFLSVKKTKIYGILLAGALIQGVLIMYMHNSFMQIIGISTGVLSLLLVLLLLYYLINKNSHANT